MRGWPLFLLIVVVGGLTYFLRTLALPILAMLGLLIYFETRRQTDLLRRIVERQTPAEGQSPEEVTAQRPASVPSSLEPEREPPEEPVQETPEGPGYHLAEPEYVSQPPEPQGSSHVREGD